MFVKELTLNNFRNFNKLNLTFSSPITIFTGNNGVGKTNILESIHILGNIKSFKQVSDFVMIKWNENFYYCSSEVTGSNFNKISIGYSSELKKKKLIIDNDVISQPSQFYGNLLTVVICPSDLSIVENTPEIRRRYFDSVISKTDKNYFEILSELKKVIHYRNIILRKYKEYPNSKKNELDVWDALFAEKSNLIVLKRMEFIKQFNAIFYKYYNIISKEQIIPNIEYTSTFYDLRINDILNVLQKNRYKEINAGFTLTGPHRDIFRINIDDKLFIESASQGQKRTAVISFKMSEIELIKKITNLNPVILIDDIFSELDQERRYNLINILNQGNQLFFTMVNSEIIDKEYTNCSEEYNIKDQQVISQIH